jgi:hypothetical protein
MVSQYSAPNSALLKLSSGALYSCEYLGPEGLRVIYAKSIRSVVGMVKHQFGEYNPYTSPDYRDFAITQQFAENSYYLVEKIGLEALHMAGNLEEEAGN